MTSTERRKSSAVINGETVFERPAVGRLVSHWREVCGDRMAPRRDEVDPIDLFEFLPHIAMIKPLDAGADFQFSLIGTGLVKLYGLVTRQNVSRIECGPEIREALQESLQLCMSEKAPVHDIWRNVRTLSQVDVTIEVAFVPISEDGIEVSRILGYHIILN